MTLHGGSGAIAPTSLTQWNSLQQQNAELVDLSKLLESTRATLRAGGIMYVVAARSLRERRPSTRS